MPPQYLAFLVACGPPPVAAPPPPVVEPAPASPPAPPPEPIAAPAPAGPPPYTASVGPVGPALREAMTGVTWKPGCPVGLDELVVVRPLHHTPDGGTAEGVLIVAADVGEAVATAFRALYDAGFVITGMRPAHEFGGDDERSMAADNTSAFNCRPITGGRSFSRHSYGTAIDVNPLRNPYVKGDRVLPPEGRAWLERDDRPGVISADGPVVAAFRDIGWRWGGAWRSAKDYQHFSTDGR